MDYQAFSALFTEIFTQNALERFCTEEIMRKFADLTDCLLEANAKFNLTAIKELPDVIAKHYADCLLAEHLFPVGATVLDLGCGGGFPTFPLAIARPDLLITAVDSTRKKIDFVAQTAKSLGISNVTALCARAEAPEMRKYRECFDVVTSRAMARMTVLAELALPFAKLGGKTVALKGAQGLEELSEAMRAIQALGGADTSAESCVLKVQNGEETRCFLQISKKTTTPPQYPRAYATILKKPL